MKKQFADKLAGEKEYFDQVTYKIYGLNNDCLRVKIVKENKNKYKHLMIVFGMLLILNLISVMVGGDGNLIKKDGNIEAIIRPDNGIYKVNLIAEIEGKNSSSKQEIPIKISSAKEMTVATNKEKVITDQELVRRAQLNKLQNDIIQMNSSDVKTVHLPQKLEDGSNLNWHVKDTNYFLYWLILFFISIGTIYMGRFNKVKKLEKEAKKSILLELPDFINKIVLLLNAGLVFSSAFNRVTESEQEKEPENYFINQMIVIREKVEGTNSSLILELKDFSERLQVRELIRTVNIISDNIYLGALLVEKLQIENDLLWENRRKYAEEQNRISETKLSFPLAIHLIVLITITIAPALLNT